jgi:hypothetical protein
LTEEELLIKTCGAGPRDQGGRTATSGSDLGTPASDQPAAVPAARLLPQALVAFPNLAHRAAASVLRAAPAPQAAAGLTPRRVVTLLKQVGRRNDAALVEKISGTLRAAALRPTCAR